MKGLLFVAVLVALASAEPIKIDRCTCFENGNYYEAVSAGGCTQFTQRTAFLPAATHNCPAGLTFDLNVCVCNWADRSVCPAGCQDYPTPTPPSDNYCEQRGNIYTPVPGTDCAKFTQATATLPPQEHSCPAGLQFNVDVCVCDWPWRTQCKN